MRAQSLEQPDSLHVLAAQGWLELGNPREAKLELDQVTPAARTHPHVLEARWQLLAAEKQWETARQIAATLIEGDPNDPLGWVHQSYCLHELKRTAEARDHLLRVVGKFQASATIRYNLACYECQLGNLDQAKKWFASASRLADRDRMKAAALEDADLEPLWEYIRST